MEPLGECQHLTFTGVREAMANISSPIIEEGLAV
jgi:hypothetical protein